jgi:hypothetical protein
VNGKDNPPANPFLVFTDATDSFPDKRSKDAIEKNNIILHAKELLNVWYLSDQICFFKATYRSSCCVAFCSKSVEEIIVVCVV